MIRRIKLVNFMSHTNTVIEPADGLTILIGQNNCGKSAIVSALQILSGNATGDFMVRHGERECVISVETDDGHTIEWRRKGGTVSYRINGRDVHRLQGNVPDELHGLLRLPEVEAEGGAFNIHFAEQKNPIFLLNETAGRRATFFASSSDAIKLIEMQKTHSRKIQDAKRLETDLVKREGKINGRLEALGSLNDLEKPLVDLEFLHKSIQDEAQAIGEISKLRQEVAHATAETKSWLVKTRALSNLAPPPEVRETRQLVDAVEVITRTAVDVATGRETCTVLQPLTTPPDLPDLTPISAIVAELDATRLAINLNKELGYLCTTLNTPPEFPSTLSLGDTIRDLQVADASVRAFGDQVDSLKIASPPPTPVETGRLSEMVGTLAAASRTVSRQRAISAAIAEVVEPPIHADTKSLSCTVDQIVETKQQLTQLRLGVQQLRADMIETERDLHGLADELHTCPVCGQDFDPVKLVATATLSVGGQS